MIAVMGGVYKIRILCQEGQDALSDGRRRLWDETYIWRCSAGFV